MSRIRVGSLHCLVGLKVSVNVVDPVPTPRGPTEIEDDDDVEIEIEIGDAAEAKVTVSATVTASDYKAIIRARGRQD